MYKFKGGAVKTKETAKFEKSETCVFENERQQRH